MRLPGKDFLEHRPEPRDVQSPPHELVEESIHRLEGRDPEVLIERPVRRLHSEVAVEDEQRLTHCLDDGPGVTGGFLEPLIGMLGLVDVEQHHDRAVDLVIRGPVRMEAKLIPAAVAVADFSLRDLHALDHLPEQQLQVGHLDGWLEVADATADVGGQQVQELPRRRRESPDAAVDAHGDDRHVAAAQEVDQVVVEPVQLRVPALKLIVDAW